MTSIYFTMASLILSLSLVQRATQQKIADKCIEHVYDYAEFMDANTHYCGNTTEYPSALSSLQNETANVVALKTYTTIYQKYLESPSVDHFSGITIHCLGVLRDIACAKEFPYCNPVTGEIKEGVVCESSCNLLKDRCPTETELIAYLCDNTSDTECAYGRLLDFFIGYGLILAALLHF